MILYRWIRYEAKAILTSSSSSLVSTTNGTVGCTKGSCGGRICRICKYSMCIIGHCCLPLSPRQLAGPGNLSKRYVYTYAYTLYFRTFEGTKVQRYTRTTRKTHVLWLRKYLLVRKYESTKVLSFVRKYFRTSVLSYRKYFRTSRIPYTCTILVMSLRRVISAVIISIIAIYSSCTRVRK